ncbi:hypothetical protein TNCV_183911 [Trichonephila clavipes]|nr:hypothetical protein TNCV_183911 [Trichonephila clavipes]
MAFKTVHGVKTVKSLGSKDMNGKCRERQQPNQTKKSLCETTQEFVETDLAILNYDQMKRTAADTVSPLRASTPQLRQEKEDGDEKRLVNRRRRLGSRETTNGDQKGDDGTELRRRADRKFSGGKERE